MNLSKKCFTTILSILITSINSPELYANEASSQIIYFNQKNLPSDTKGALEASVSLAQSLIIPTLNKIENDQQPHLVGNRDALIIFEPHNKNIKNNAKITVKALDANGKLIHQATLKSPDDQPLLAGQLLMKVDVKSPKQHTKLINNNKAIRSLTEKNGQENIIQLLNTHDSIKIATRDGHWGKRFFLPEDKAFDGKTITFASKAGYNSHIFSALGEKLLTRNNTIVFHNIDGKWYTSEQAKNIKIRIIDVNEPTQFDLTINSNTELNNISNAGGQEGKEAFKNLLKTNKTLKIALSDRNWAKEFTLPDDSEFHDTIVTFTSNAAWNSHINYSLGSRTLSNGSSFTFKNVQGKWFIAGDADINKISYSKNAFTTILPAKAVQPGVVLHFTHGKQQGVLEGVWVGAPTRLILNLLDVGIFTPPSDNMKIAQDPKFQQDYFQIMPISELIANTYEPIQINEVILPDGRKLTDYDPGGYDAYGSETHYRITRELFSSGINSANYGYHSSTVRWTSQWNIDAPYFAARITVNKGRGKYRNSRIQAHGLLGSYAGVASVMSTIGNEFSHEVGHELGVGAHYPGAFAGAVHNISTEVNSSWGWNSFSNLFIPNFRKHKNNGNKCNSGKCALPFHGHQFGSGTMSGGSAFYPSENAYTLLTPYESVIFQRTLENKVNFDPTSSTGFTKWNKNTQKMEPWTNQVTDNLDYKMILIGDQENLQLFGQNSTKYDELFKTYNVIRLHTSGGNWAKNFYLPDETKEGNIVEVYTGGGWSSDVHYSGEKITVKTREKRLFRFTSGQWEMVKSDFITRKIPIIPTKQGVPVTTIVGYYDPQNELTSYIYPALHGASGAIYQDTLTPSSCQLIVSYQYGENSVFNLHGSRLKSTLMNKFHVNVETQLNPSQAELYCNGTLLASQTLDLPKNYLFANVINSSNKFTRNSRNSDTDISELMIENNDGRHQDYSEEDEQAGFEIITEDILTIYTHAKFKGEALAITMDTPDLGALNNQMSSYKVKKGYSVRFFEFPNYEGRYWTRKASSNDSSFTKDFNDLVSSVKVFKD